LGRAAHAPFEGVSVNALDYAVLVGAILSIAAYGIWRTSGERTMRTYLEGEGHTPWYVIGLSVMATQASAITFLSTPGQGFQSGLGFVQNYFGMPIALIIIAAVFLPIYRRLNVYTAYEYLGQRFDKKTRLLGTAVFLLQRGLGAGFTLYAPAIVLSTMLGWRLDLTILCSGLVVIAYTTSGGSEAVNVTQKYQLSVIFAGMLSAFVILWLKLPKELSMSDVLSIAGSGDKLNGVDYSFNLHNRYTIWSGVLAATFLMLAYFGTDQSQVQRYISGGSLRESRLGLMFNAVFKIPMQFFILSIGVLMFVFYQFDLPPVYFNQVAWQSKTTAGDASKFRDVETRFAAAHEEEKQKVQAWITSRHMGDLSSESEAQKAVAEARIKVEDIRNEASKLMGETKDSDYVFITFILNHLPHGVIGLLIATFFAATLSSKAAELNALSTTTMVDIYRHLIRPDASDEYYVRASRVVTVSWGIVAIGFGLLFKLSENLIEAVNILGSIFYPVMIGLFIVGFFFRWVQGTAVFFGALAAQVLVISFYFMLPISYLWYNPFGCIACVLLSIVCQFVLGKPTTPNEAELVP
jgi:SSS family solute:Na+ symporter